MREIENLTEIESKLFRGEGFWREKYDKYREQWEKEMDAKKTKKFHISITEKQILVPKYSIILGDHVDIISLFSTAARMGSFLDYMFKRAFGEELKGAIPFYFYPRSKSYNFDYPYLLLLIMSWMVEELDVDKDDAHMYMSQFRPKGSRNNEAAAFLIQVVFDHKYDILATPFLKNGMKLRGKMMRNIYYNPSTVFAPDGEEYYYRSVPFSSEKILYLCTKEVMEMVIQRRSELELEQTSFGKQSVEDDDLLDQFFIFNAYEKE